MPSKASQEVTILSENLTPLEKEVYELIKKSSELLTTDIPSRMRGAVPRLVEKGLVEAYKKPTSPWSPKKRKYLKAKEA